MESRKIVIDSESAIKIQVILARIDERMNKIESDIEKTEKTLTAIDAKLDEKFRLLFEATENRFLWTILTVLASNVLPLVLHAAGLV